MVKHGWIQNLAIIKTTINVPHQHVYCTIIAFLTKLQYFIKTETKEPTKRIQYMIPCLGGVSVPNDNGSEFYVLAGQYHRAHYKDSC